MIRSMLVACFALLSLPGWASAQDDAPAIIKKALQAAGMSTDNRMYHETWKESGKMNAMGITLSYDSTWAFEAPDKYRFDMKGQMPGGQPPFELTFIQNGKRARQSAMGQSMELTGPKLEETTHSGYQFWVCSLRPLLSDTAFKLAVLGEKEFGGKPVTSVKVSRDGRRDVTLHFDKKTGLLAGCSDVIKDEFQNWKEVPQDTEFGDYVKGPGGEMFFKSMTVKRDGKVLLQSTFSDYQRSTTPQPDKFKLN